jgi:hypothetical protein
MTYAGADPVASGRPYDVSSVNGQEPTSLDDFIGQVAFTVASAGADKIISGVGSAVGDVVHFQEKDVAHDGKDVRVWQLSANEAGGFRAEASGTF